MQKYECAVVFLPSPADEETPNQVETVKGWLTAVGAEISDVDIWGRKRLAYPIRKQPEGMYVIYYFDLEDGSRLRELERRFKTSEFILRHLLVRLPALKETPRIPREEPAAAAPEEAKEEEKAEAAPAAQPGEEIELEAETPKTEEPGEPAAVETQPAAEEPTEDQPAAPAEPTAAEQQIEEQPAVEPEADKRPADGDEPRSQE